MAHSVSFGLRGQEMKMKNRVRISVPKYEKEMSFLLTEYQPVQSQSLSKDGEGLFGGMYAICTGDPFGRGWESALANGAGTCFSNNFPGARDDHISHGTFHINVRGGNSASNISLTMHADVDTKDHIITKVHGMTVTGGHGKFRGLNSNNCKVIYNNNTKVARFIPSPPMQGPHWNGI